MLAWGRVREPVEAARAACSKKGTTPDSGEEGGQRPTQAPYQLSQLTWNFDYLISAVNGKARRK